MGGSEGGEEGGVCEDVFELLRGLVEENFG